jgi:hypothetical protein
MPHYFGFSRNSFIFPRRTQLSNTVQQFIETLTGHCFGFIQNLLKSLISIVEGGNSQCCTPGIWPLSPLARWFLHAKPLFRLAVIKSWNVQPCWFLYSSQSFSKWKVLQFQTKQTGTNRHLYYYFNLKLMTTESYRRLRLTPRPSLALASSDRR